MRNNREKAAYIWSVIIYVGVDIAIIILFLLSEHMRWWLIPTVAYHGAKIYRLLKSRTDAEREAGKGNLVETVKYLINKDMQHPMTRHIILIEKNIVLFGLLFVILNGLCGWYEIYLMDRMPTWLTGGERLVRYLAILCLPVGGLVTLIRSAVFIVKNILLADLSDYKWISKEWCFVGMVVELVMAVLLCIFSAQMLMNLIKG